MEMLTSNYIKKKNMVNYPIAYCIILIKYSFAMIKLTLVCKKELYQCWNIMITVILHHLMLLCKQYIAHFLRTNNVASFPNGPP